jgi:hypothetical protein
MKHVEQWMGELEWWQAFLLAALVCTVGALGKEMFFPYKKSNGRGK